MAVGHRPVPRSCVCGDRTGLRGNVRRRRADGAGNVTNFQKSALTNVTVLIRECSVNIEKENSLATYQSIQLPSGIGRHY